MSDLLIVFATIALMLVILALWDKFLDWLSPKTKRCMDCGVRNENVFHPYESQSEKQKWLCTYCWRKRRWQR